MPNANTCSPCCGSGGTIGFDDTIRNNLWTGCFGTLSPIAFLASNVSRLSECKVVFAGLLSCNSAVKFASGDWPAVKTYIQNGGRLVFVTEFQGCLADPTAVASFLSALGSSITWLGGSYDAGATASCTPGTANIAQGLSFYLNATAELSGGTSVWVSPSGKQMLQVEAIGSGFLFVCGDSNVLENSIPHSDCAFWQRVFNDADGDII